MWARRISSALQHNIVEERNHLCAALPALDVSPSHRERGSSHPSHGAMRQGNGSRPQPSHIPASSRVAQLVITIAPRLLNIAHDCVARERRCSAEGFQ
jgi:hypothetical protein